MNEAVRDRPCSSDPLVEEPEPIWARTLSRRAAELLAKSDAEICTRTDRMFAGLLAFQSVLGIAAALWVSPLAWEGRTSHVHPHVWAAVLLGGVISIFPIVMIRLTPGAMLTRQSVAIAQMLSSALLIHLMGGRIETHFHVFGSLAFLAFYRDRSLLVTASGVIALDHILRGFFWPESVYGVLEASPWRSIEHAAWIVFEDLFLMIAITKNRHEMRRTAEQQARLEVANEVVEIKVLERTAELASSEERFRTLSAASPVGIFQTDAEGRCVYANQCWQELTGLGDEETLGAVWTKIVHPDEREEIERTWRKVVAAQKTFTAEFRLLTPQGMTRSIVSSGAALRSNQGSLTGYVGTLSDISQRKHLELSLHQAQKLEAVGQLASGIAHEINTPIQFVSDSVHFLKDGFKDLRALLGQYGKLRDAALSGAVAPGIIEAVEQSEENADVGYLVEEIPKAIDRTLEGAARVAEIVRAMKDFAHPDQREKVAADLNRSILSTLTVACNELKYVADVETDLAELPPVICHPGELNQVVLNLLVNAAHAIADVRKDSDPRGRITVRTRLENDEVVVSVSDTGAGIPEHARARIFEPFFTTKAVGKGTGQGLAIARSIIVDKHGGSMTFESEVGRGTTFYLRLPVGAGATAAAPAGGVLSGFIPDSSCL